MVTIFSFGPGKDDLACRIGDNWAMDLNARCYALGIDPPHFPVPAIPLKVYLEGYNPGHDIYIDSLEYGEDDPQLVKAWINYSWYGRNPPDYIVEV